MKKKLLEGRVYSCQVEAGGEGAAKPGWSNTPMQVVVESGKGRSLRVRCLQPYEQTPVMRDLYKAAAAIHEVLLREIGYVG